MGEREDHLTAVLDVWRRFPVETVADLARALREEGLPADARQCLLARRVLAIEPLVHGTADLHRLRNAFGSIFCGTPRHVARFSVCFEGWTSGRLARVQEVVRLAGDGGDEALDRPEPPAWRKRLLRTSIGVLYALVVVTLVFTAPGPQGTSNGPGDEANRQPGGTNGSGSGGGIPPEPGLPGVIVPPELPDVKEGPTDVNERPPTEAPSGPGFPWVRSLVAATILILSLGLWWHLRGRAFLRRIADRVPEDVDPLALQAQGYSKETRARLSRAAAWLRRRRPEPSRLLDVRATVEASVRNCGWFVPRYSTRLAPPSYVALVERRHPLDHQARRMRDWIDALRAEGVFVAEYAFRGDPRLCTELGDTGRTVRLRELAHRHEGAALWILSDGDGLLDPLTGEPALWTGVLDAWPQRAVLTPEPTESWGEREAILAGTGLQVEFAGPDGFAETASAMPRSVYERLVDIVSIPTLPRDMRPQQSVWLGPDAPGKAVLESGLDAVRYYLGADGYRWLCACAVYPQVRWGLTMLLGRELTGASGGPLLTADSFNRLVRLPWFRESYLPDWLRIRLLDDLERDDENAIRRLLHSRLGGEEAGALLAIGRGRKLDADSPERDTVFAGLFGNRLAFRLARAVRRLVRRHREERRPIVSQRVLRRAGSIATGVGFWAVILYLIFRPGPVDHAWDRLRDPSLAAKERRAALDFLLQEGEPLRGVDLRGLDLPAAWLTDADLGDANLSGIDLTGAVFWDTDLTGCKLDDAVLTAAVFTTPIGLRSPLYARFEPDEPPRLYGRETVVDPPNYAYPKHGDVRRVPWGPGLLPSGAVPFIVYWGESADSRQGPDQPIGPEQLEQAFARLLDESEPGVARETRKLRVDDAARVAFLQLGTARHQLLNDALEEHRPQRDFQSLLDYRRRIWRQDPTFQASDREQDPAGWAAVEHLDRVMLSQPGIRELVPLVSQEVGVAGN